MVFEHTHTLAPLHIPCYTHSHPHGQLGVLPPQVDEHTPHSIKMRLTRYKGTVGEGATHTDKNTRNASNRETHRDIAVVSLVCYTRHTWSQLSTNITALGLSIRGQPSPSRTPAGEGKGRARKPETEHCAFSKLRHHPAERGSGELAGDSMPQRKSPCLSFPQLTLYVLQLPHTIRLFHVVDGEALKSHFEILHLRKEEVVPGNGVLDRRMERRHCLYSAGHTTPALRVVIESEAESERGNE